MNTDRPDFTESTRTVGLGRIQLETGYTYVYDDAPGMSLEQHSYPEILIRAGMLADWFELRIIWSYLESVENFGGPPERAEGALDMSIGCKIALTEQCGCRPEMAMIAQMSIPTGSPVYSDDEVLPGLIWIYSWELSECLSFAGSTQGNRVRDDSDHYHMEFAQSAVFGWSLAEQLGAYLEWFAFFPHNAIDPGARPEHYMDGGFTFLLNSNLQYDVRAGVGLNEVAVDYFVGTGFAVRY